MTFVFDVIGQGKCLLSLGLCFLIGRMSNAFDQNKINGGAFTFRTKKASFVL